MLNENGNENKRKKKQNGKMKVGNGDIPVYRETGEMNANGWKRKIISVRRPRQTERSTKRRGRKKERNNKLKERKKSAIYYLETMSTWINSQQRALN